MMYEKGRKGMESRMRLLEVAANEFANHGFHETKISTIVKTAGLTQPSFYLYFSSKESIFEELISEFHSRLKKLIESVRLEENLKQKDISKRLAKVVEIVFLFLKNDPNLTRIGFCLNPNAELFKADFTKVLMENLQAEQKLGYFRSDLDMEMVAECLSNTIERLTFVYLIPGIKDSKSLATQIVSLFMQGMLANTEPSGAGENN